MTELKTLKDFDDMGELILNIENLKAEAVKWIKYDIEYMGADIGTLRLMHPRIVFWMERFNITEEDLEEKRSAN